MPESQELPLGPDCPVHEAPMKGFRTKYGVRFNCQSRDSGVHCTYACWDGSTSTPADSKTRSARRRAHQALDPIWEEGRHSRTWLYKRLAEFFMVDEFHIGEATYTEAVMVRAFARTINLVIPRAPKK